MNLIVSFMDSTTKTGLRITCADPSVMFPAQGRLYNSYSYGGVETLEFTPDTSGYWVDVGGLLEPVFGCVTLRHLSDTTHSQHFTVIIGGPRMAYRDIPVDRSEATGLPKIIVLKDGIEMPVTIDDLSNAGIIQNNNHQIDVDIPAIPLKFMTIFK